MAVLDGKFDVGAGLDLLPDERVDQWSEWLDVAESESPNSLSPNECTFTALQSAAAAIRQTPIPDAMPCGHLQSALGTAIQTGNDTDTVAAIAGGLLGARWGASAVPRVKNLRGPFWPVRT